MSAYPRTVENQYRKSLQVQDSSSTEESVKKRIISVAIYGGHKIWYRIW